MLRHLQTNLYLKLSASYVYDNENIERFHKRYTELLLSFNFVEVTGILHIPLNFRLKSHIGIKN